MLIIKPIQTKEEQKNLCILCGAEYDADCMAYSAREDDALLGISQFRILGDNGVIYDLKNKIGVIDTEALIIMGRATLNFIDLLGIKNVIIKEDTNNLPQILGFKKTHGIFKINLEGYFDSPCKKSNGQN